MEQLIDFAATSLNGGINNSVTTLTVTSATSFPTSGNFRILIGSEIMKVTGVSSNTFTVLRGQEGTTAASHADLDTVTYILTKAGLDAWIDDNHIYDVINNLPTAGKPGRFFIPSDYTAFAIDDGTQWLWFTGLEALNLNPVPPIDANFSWQNQGSATVDVTAGGVYLSTPAAAGCHIRARYRAKTAPYKVTMQFNAVMLDTANNNACGMGFYSTTGLHYELIEVTTSGGVFYVEVMKGNDLNTFNTQQTYNVAQDIGGRLNWLQIEDDNTNLYFRYSTNGVDWNTLHLESRTTQFSGGPTGVFFHVNANQATNPSGMHVLHWLEQ